MFGRHQSGQFCDCENRGSCLIRSFDKYNGHDVSQLYQVPGTVLRALRHLLIDSLLQPCEVCAIVIFVLQIRKLR